MDVSGLNFSNYPSISTFFWKPRYRGYYTEDSGYAHCERRQHQSQTDLAGKDLVRNNYDRTGNQAGNIWREVHMRWEDYIRRIWQDNLGQRTDSLLDAQYM